MSKLPTITSALMGLALAASAGSATAAYRGYDSGYYPRDAYSSPYARDDSRYGRTIRCESHDNRTTWCGADTRGGVRLVDQLSRDTCIRGRSWGADARGVWVSRGCRGVFAVNDMAYGGGYGGGYGNGGYAGGRVVRCESRDGRTRYCSMDTRAGVTLIDQHSSSPCIEGSTWGVSRDRVWVSRGCRGDFATGAVGYGYGNRDYDRRY